MYAARYDRPCLIHQTHVKEVLDTLSFKDGSGRELRCLHNVILQHLRALKIHGFKDQRIQCFFAASDANIKEFWSTVLRVYSTLKNEVLHSKAKVSGQQSLLDFMDHCCQYRHYMYSSNILKCGLPNCTICKPPRLPKEKFD